MTALDSLMYIQDDMNKTTVKQAFRNQYCIVLQKNMENKKREPIHVHGVFVAQIRYSDAVPLCPGFAIV